MRKKKYISFLLAACISLGIVSDAQAVGILRPNIRIKDKAPAQQTAVATDSKPAAPVSVAKEISKDRSENKAEQKVVVKTVAQEKTTLQDKEIVRTREKRAPNSELAKVKVTTEPSVKHKDAIHAPIIIPKNPQLDSELAGMLGDKGAQVPGIGVIAYKNNARSYENFLGRRYIFQDRTGDLPFSSDSRFRVGTISQQIVVLAALQLVEEGKLNLDEDISKYLGFSLHNPNSPEIKITPRMLMSHTSGLRDGKYDMHQGWQEIFKEEKGLFAPKNQKVGEYFHYANINYRLLATALEKISGTRFDLFMKHGILKDLDIKGGYNTCDFKPNEQKLLGGIYQKQSNGAWNENGAWILQMDDYQALKGHKAHEFFVQLTASGSYEKINLSTYEIGKNASIFMPESGLRASVEELSHILEMIFSQGSFMDKKVLDEKLLDEMFKIQWFYDDWDKTGETYGGLFEAYGLGVMPFFNGSTTRLSTVKAHQWWGQIGDNNGMISGLVVDRRTKCGYVYMANGQAMNWTDARSKGKFSKHIIWQENINDAICRNLFKD